MYGSDNDKICLQSGVIIQIGYRAKKIDDAAADRKANHQRRSDSALHD
jgi:hypothetical protein